MNPARRRSALSLGAAVIGLVSLTGCQLHPNDNTLPGQVAVGDDGYTVTVYFDRIENLVANSTVQRDDVTIGTVAKVEVDDWKAKVTLRLKRSVRIPGNAIFSIGQKTLLGAQYIQVNDPAAPPTGLLDDGQVVDTDHTGTYPATEQVLASASLLLNNGGLSQISTITGELNKTFDERVPDTRAVIGKLNDLMAVLDANKSQIVSTLESLESLSGRLAADRTVVAEAIDRITPGLTALNEERSTLVTALSATGKLSDSATRLVNLNQRALVGSISSLRPILTQLGKVSAQLPESLKYLTTLPFPVMTTPEAVKGDYTNLFATIDLSMSSLARNFLAGGLLPSMQAGDPTSDPLRQTPDADSSSSTPRVPGQDAQDQSPSTSVEPGSGDPSLVCGLLTVLGGCS